MRITHIIIIEEDVVCGRRIKERVLRPISALDDLSAWQRALFGHVMCFTGTFTTQQIYAKAQGPIANMWPDNRSVQADIRDELQNLRDFGLLVFGSDHGRRGVYWATDLARRIVANSDMRGES